VGSRARKQNKTKKESQSVQYLVWHCKVALLALGTDKNKLKLTRHEWGGGDAGSREVLLRVSCLAQEVDRSGVGGVDAQRRWFRHCSLLQTTPRVGVATTTTVGCCRHKT